MSISRRNLLTQSAAFAAVVMSFGPAQAKAPLAGAQIPGVFRYKVGSLEVTALLDGYLDIEHNLFPAADPAVATAADDCGRVECVLAHEPTNGRRQRLPGAIEFGLTIPASPGGVGRGRLRWARCRSRRFRQG